MTSRSRHETLRERWERKRASLVELLESLRTANPGENEAWYTKMEAYYSRKLADLERDEPTEDQTG